MASTQPNQPAQNGKFDVEQFRAGRFVFLMGLGGLA
jgi:hypothetical protein